MPRVAIAGGSIGGLTAALLLRDIGCEVEVYERSSSALEARGAGIAVLEQTMRYPVERLGVRPEDFCTQAEWIRFLARDGSVQHAERHPYLFSSWNAVYRMLLGGLGSEQYHLGQELLAFENHEDFVSLELSTGETRDVDLLVCADGINSAARQRLLPEIKPEYAGYVAWRGVVPEAELSARSFEVLNNALTYQLIPHSHILVYPIPGLGGSVKLGERLMNMVWYRNVAEVDLERMLTDRHGTRRGVSLPPGAAADELVTEMRRDAGGLLAPAISEVVTSIKEPFVQAVFDIEVPVMVHGRCCLLGDAAFAARPHAAAGTAKAAEDGWVLARELEASAGDVAKALRGFEEQQVVLGASLVRRTREIGNSSQFTGSFSPGDSRLIFGLYGPGK